MKTELYTLSKIFTENLFRIPDYQRGYSWTMPQLKDFWLDLDQIGKSNKHYTGVLTLETVPRSKWETWEDDAWIIESKGFSPYYIVDGQQRLTTAIILMQCIIESAAGNQLNFTTVEQVRQKFIYDSKAGEILRSYIFGYEKDNPSYEYLKKEIFIEESANHLPDEETIYTKNLRDAKLFFKGQIKEIDPVKLDSLYTKLTQQMLFNVYEISSDVDVFMAFETMNNRGKALSTLELLKNRLIYLSAKITSPNSRESESLRKAINESWKSVYHFLGKNENRRLIDDAFLVTHLRVYIAKIGLQQPERLEYRHRSEENPLASYMLNSLFSQKRIGQTGNETLPEISCKLIQSYAKDIKKSVEVYYKLSTPLTAYKVQKEEAVILDGISRIYRFSTRPMLLAVYAKESPSKSRESFIREYERNLVFATLASASGHYYPNSLSLNNNELMLEYIDNKKKIEDITKAFKQNSTEILQKISPIESLASISSRPAGYYDWTPLVNVLYEYECNARKKAKATESKLIWEDLIINGENQFGSIEHIYPQQPKDNYWTSRYKKYTLAQRKTLANSIGNLVLIPGAKNSSLGNKPFPEKCGGDGEFRGYKYGSFSEIEIAENAEWTAMQILRRGISILTFMEQRWGFKVGDDEAKIKALNLEFVK